MRADDAFDIVSPPIMESLMSKEKPMLADDMLYGVEKIAEFLGMPARKVFYLAANAQMPVFKIGEGWTARRSTLVGWIEALEQGTIHLS